MKKKTHQRKQSVKLNTSAKKSKKRSVNNSRNRSIKKLQYEFINSTSHQLRTPIATIQSSLEVLELYIKRENTARQIQMLNRIKASLAGLKETLERITTIYKHEIIKQRLKVSQIEPHKFFNDLLVEVIIGTENTHYVNMNVDANVFKFFADEFVLKQILINLLNNSVKFSPAGGQIQLSVLMNKKQLEISVKDEGIGIDKKDLAKLYEPFFRGKNSTTIPGNGLGLTIVKKLCDMHKIKIECNSNLNKGTEFKLVIPQKQSI